MSDNYDANDVAKRHGLDEVRKAFERRQDMLPPVPPYDGEGEPETVKIEASPFVWRDPADIPPRKWLYGRHLIRKFLSVDIAAGGIGKSSVKIVESLAMVSNRALLQKEIFEGPLKVWYYNLEDPLEETERRIHAAAQYFNIGKGDIGERLYVNSGRDQPVVLAEETPDGVRIIRPVVDSLIEQIKGRWIDVVTIDPFVSSHQVSENDNRAIDMVAKEWSRIAEICDCAINLVHHVRKSNGQEVNADSARGAKALTDAARSVVVYNRMTKEEGERANIAPDKRGFYFRTQNDKANLAPPEAADWHRMNSVELPNGDHVGVACSWRWPDSFEGVTITHLKQVQARVAEGQFRRDVQAKSWVGTVIADVCNLDARKDKNRIKDIIKQWLETDMLREVEAEDDQRHVRTFVEVGTWHTD